MAHDAIIIGGGIAGASIAHALQKQWQNILIVDAGSDNASSNPKGIIRPFLSLGDDWMRQFYHHAYDYCMGILAQYPDVILQHGILQFPKADEEKRLAGAPTLAGFDESELQYLTAAQASHLMQTEILSDALFWPRAAVIDPSAWVRALRGKTPVMNNTKIISVRRDDVFHCRTDNGAEISARAVYVACGHAMNLIPEVHQHIRPRMGQISLVAQDMLPSFQHAISLGHYFIPSMHGEDHIVGATYEHTDVTAVTDGNHHRNLTALQEMARFIPALAPVQNLTAADCKGRAAVRATMLNHLPSWGRADNGLFYLTGFGSRGLMSAPYTAKLLIEAE